MSSLSSRLALILALLSAGSLSAQTDTIARPKTTAVLAKQVVPPGGASVPIDLRNHFTIQNETGDKFVQFDTVYGKFNVILRGGRAPKHVENFLKYVHDGRYTNLFFHRTAGGTTSTVASIAQSGGFRLPYSTAVEHYDPIGLEGTLTHELYTLAAARTSDPNSATSQFFFNLVDNTNTYFPGQSTTNQDLRYTVYGRVVGSGGAALKQVGMLPVYNMVDGSANTTAFQTIPLRDKVPNILTEKNLILIRSITEVPLYPTGNETSVLNFTAQSTNPEVAQVSLTGSTLNIQPGVVNGTTRVTVTASEVAGDTVTAEFDVETNSELSIARPPRSQVIAAGDAVLFDVEAVGAGLSYQWQHNGTPINGATSPVLFIRGVDQEDAGNYSVVVSNTVGSVTSALAGLTVVDDSAAKSRLSNLSVRSFAGNGEETLIAGFAAEGGTVNLVMRGIGPTLANFGVSNVLLDPEIKLFNVPLPGTSANLLGANNDWTQFDGSTVGGFPLPVGSKDAVLTSPYITGGNTLHINGLGDTSGMALIELYEGPDSVGSLVNLSARTLVRANENLIGGFTLSGTTSRTVLVRAVGPGLSNLGITEFFQDPKLSLHSTKGTLVAQNDNWGGSTALSEAFLSVGAFSLTDPNSKDAAILTTLEPGGYTAVITGPTGHTGVVLLEVYLVR